MRREGRARVTTTGGPRADGGRAGLDAARLSTASRLRSALADLSGGAGATAGAPGGFPAAPAREMSRAECRPTRASLHDYLHGRLLPSRRRRVEAHLDGCAECTRAFIDVREVSWSLRGHSRRLAADDHRGGRHRRPPRRRVVAAGA